MNYITKEITLKDARTAVFRVPGEEDARELLQYLVDTAGETPFLLRTPEECTLTVEEEEIYLRNAAFDPNKTLILCTVDGRIAGNCQMERKTKLKNRHRAGIGIALRKEYWGLGIGTAMFRELIRLAKEDGIEQLELEVFEGNKRAIGLYEKMGFSIVAATPNAIRLPDGTVWKEYLMIKELSGL